MPGSRRHRTPPKACGPGFLGQGVGKGCTGLRPHASAHPPRAATCPHSTPAPHPAQQCRRHARHGTGRPALRTRAFSPPKHAPKARRLAPCARLTSARPLCRSDLTVQEEGGHRTSRARSSRRSCSRQLVEPSCRAPTSPGRSAARLAAASRSLMGRIGCHPTVGPGPRPGRPLCTVVSCRGCLSAQASSLGHAWPSQASKWASLSQWCHGTTLRNLGYGSYK